MTSTTGTTSPIGVILAFHNAFRADIATIDEAALAAARAKQDTAPALGRYHFLNEMLFWHADGEEAAVFPALEEVAPLVVEPYARDHRGLDVLSERLDEAVSARDALETARVTAAFKFHLDMHLGKEDTHLYRLVRERIPGPAQAKMVGVFAGSVPQDRFPDVIAWFFPLIGPRDRENTLRVWQMIMPPDIFAMVTPLVRRAVGTGWAELARAFPDLAA